MDHYFTSIIDVDLKWYRKDYVEANIPIRFVNFLIDYLSIYCVATCVGIFVGYISSIEYLFFNSHQLNPFLDYVILSSTLMVYFSTEYFFNGKSFAKFLTQTRVVHNREAQISFKIYLLRSLWRLVPCEFLSFLPGLGERFHDQYSDTLVIYDY